MAQIAQQDHLYIEVANIASLTSAEEKEIYSKLALNSLLDVVLVTDNSTAKTCYKVINYAITKATGSLEVNVGGSGAVTKLTISKPE